MSSVAAPPGVGDRLGEILLSENLLTRDQLGKALVEQKTTGHRLGFVLVQMGVLPEVEITKVLARQHRMPAVDLSRFEVDQKILKLIPSDVARKHCVRKDRSPTGDFPVGLRDGGAGNRTLVRISFQQGHYVRRPIFLL